MESYHNFLKAQEKVLYSNTIELAPEDPFDLFYKIIWYAVMSELAFLNKVNSFNKLFKETTHVN